MRYTTGGMTEPLVEAIGNTLAYYMRCDSQEQARRVVDTVIEVVSRYHASPSGS